MHKVAGVRIQIWIQVRIHDTAFRNDNIGVQTKTMKIQKAVGEREKVDVVVVWN